MKYIRKNLDENDASPDVFVDVNLLVTSGVTHSDVDFLYSVMQEDTMDLELNGDFTRYSDILPYITGYARILHYTSLKKDARGRFNPLLEG